ncbi:MAG: HAD-IA family hydrolase [Parvibaculaceae bacterium]|nr:HAD-IA family hydrolase [Parvibaculaceae bacterium]
MSERKLVLFDCDGTLIDSQHMIVAAMNHAFAKSGLVPLPRARVLSIVGLSLHQAVTTLMPDAAPALVEAVSAGYRDAFYELRSRRDLSEPLFEGIMPLLEALAARGDILMGVATGKTQKGLKNVLQNHDMARFFVTLQTADDAPSKPHPGMIHNALAETGVAARDTVMIGDTTYDVEMALAAGAHAIGVTWGYHPRSELVRVGAHHVLHDRAGLLPTLKGIWGEAVEDRLEESA